MKHSKESSVVHDAALPSFDFVLPDIEALPRRGQRISTNQFLKFCEDMHGLFPHARQSEEERWDRKRHMEFNI